MVANYRITPAYAGNTFFFLFSIRFSEDHPRLRGEHKLESLIDVADNGSPPPTRGTLHRRIYSQLITGITPAYAGNTYNYDFDTVLEQDHPRLRGEHFLTFLIVLASLGSPPPTRGTHAQSLFVPP